MALSPPLPCEGGADQPSTPAEGGRGHVRKKRKAFSREGRQAGTRRKPRQKGEGLLPRTNTVYEGKKKRSTKPFNGMNENGLGKTAD